MELRVAKVLLNKKYTRTVLIDEDDTVKTIANHFLSIGYDSCHVISINKVRVPKSEECWYDDTEQYDTID